MIDRHLIHTCDIQRAATIKDAYNAERKTFAAWLTGVRCRLVIKQQRDLAGMLAEQPVLATYLLLLPGGTPIQVGDQVVNIVFEDGEIDAGPYRIAAVLPRRGPSERHRSVTLERGTAA